MEPLCMIEVFKTNVKYRDDADMLLRRIHESYTDVKANFDLDDCDRILRVISTKGPVDAEVFIGLLNAFGFKGEILSDDVLVSSNYSGDFNQIPNDGL